MPLSRAGESEFFGSATISSLNGAAAVSVPLASTFCVTVTGSWVATLVFEATLDGINWFGVPAFTPFGVGVTSLTTNASVMVPVGGVTQVRTRASAYTSGTIEISWTTDSQILPNFANYPNTYSNRTGNGTFVVKSGFGTLQAIMINNDNTGGDLVVYDNTAGSGTVLFAAQLGSPSGGLLSSSGLRGMASSGLLNCSFNTGLTVVLSGSNNNNITVLYR